MLSTSTILIEDAIVPSVESIVPKLQRSPSYVLGLGTVGRVSIAARASIATGLVFQLVDATRRSAMRVDWESDPQDVGIQRDLRIAPSVSADTTEHSVTKDGNPLCVDQAVWHLPGASKQDMHRWGQQLSTLVAWRDQYGLIFMNLGRLDQVDVHLGRACRVCDGIVLGIEERTDGPTIKRVIRHLQTDRLPVLGAWSLESNHKCDSDAV